MEGVVVSQWLLFAPELASSSQILVGALALTRRLVFETLWSKGSNQCRPRSTTSKPAMESDASLFQNYTSGFELVIILIYY
jgi:hypothetical protein